MTNGGLDSVMTGRVLGLPAHWFVVLAGPLLWSFQLFVNYVLVSLACNTGFTGGRLLGMTGINILLLLIMLIVGVVTLYAGVLAFRLWRADRRTDAVTRERHVFMAFAGIVNSTLYLLGILIFGLPAFFLNSCV